MMTSWKASKDEAIESFIAAGIPLIGLLENSKVADTADWRAAQSDPSDSPARYPYGYGVVIQPEFLVFDVDPKGYRDGDDSFLRLKLDLGLTDDDFDTFTVKTREYANGKEGLHFYFRRPPGYNLRKTLNKEYPGLELLTNAYVVGPGTVHPNTKKPYEIKSGDISYLKPAPEALLNRYTRAVETQDKGTEGYKDDDYTRQRYIAYLASIDPAVQGAGGDNHTFQTALVGRDYGLTEQATYDLMLACFNPRCSPPWAPSELAKKVGNAYKYSRDNIGNARPEAQFDVFDAPPPPKQNEITIGAFEKARKIKCDRKQADIKANIHWITGDKGWDPAKEDRDEPKLANALANVVNLFRRPDYGDYRNPLYKLVRRNELTQNIELTRPAPWHTEGASRTTWTDQDTIMLCAYFSATRHWDPPKSMVLDGVMAAAEIWKYHPMKQYFAGLEWDGENRVRYLLSYYAGAEDTRYTQEVSKCLMVALVARVMQPGCKYDQMVIMEGPQGTGKSTFCEVLGRKEYYAALLDFRPKNNDTAQILLGRHVIEIPELVNFKKSDVESLKAFLSNHTDVIRLPYGRIVSSLPRTSVFIGTTNEFDGYLPDATGSRRFWPVKTGDIKTKELQADIDQLYAEAYYMWRSGEEWYITDPELIEIARIEQLKRSELDPWAETIQLWLTREEAVGYVYEKLSFMDIVVRVLGLSPDRVDRYTQTRVKNAMLQLGWKPGVRIQIDGVLKRGYKNPHYAQDRDRMLHGI